ncbi:MAG: DUF6194 family protein [Chloroflexota bacterium]
MDEASITQYIMDTFDGVETVTMPGATFFFYGPDRMLPFTTLVNNDDFDQVSNLSRPDVFRLNIGIKKQTFLSLLGTHGDAGGSYDYTTLDQLMSHPDYGSMNWVCVLNPGAETFETVVRPLLAEAHNIAFRNHTNREARKQAAAE